MVNTSIDPITRRDREEKDKRAKKEVEDLIENFKAEKAEWERHEKIKSMFDRLKRKINKLDGKEQDKLSCLLDEYAKLMKEYDSSNESFEIVKLFKSLLERLDTISKDVMKKLIEYTNLGYFFGEKNVSKPIECIDISPIEYLNKCDDIDDEIIYMFIMRGDAYELRHLIDASRFDKVSKKAFKDIKGYLYPGTFEENRKLFWYHFGDEWITFLEYFSKIWDLDGDFCEFVVEGLHYDVNKKDRKYFKWMTDSEFDEALALNKRN